MIRKLFAAALAAVCSIATAATLSPVQLLNPSGSTAGQAIVSTGASTPPAWGGIGVASLAPVAANTVIGNFTGSSAAPGAFAVASCSAANSALKYTSGTGLSCGTTFALTSGNLSQFSATTSIQLSSVLSDETGSGAVVFGTSPSLATPAISGASLSGTFSGTPTFSGAVTFSSTLNPSQTAGIVGTTTNNNANAGSVGEYATNSTSAVSLSTGTSANCTSISLSAGDWDITGSVLFGPAAGTTIQSLQVGINGTSATLPSTILTTLINASFTTSAGDVISAPTTRASLASTTTIYLVGRASFGVSTMTCDGTIRARRVR